MEKKKMKIWKKLLIALGVIIALLAIVFIGYKLYDYMDKETRFKEFEKRDYVKTEGTLSYVGDNSSKVEDMDYVKLVNCLCKKTHLINNRYRLEFNNIKITEETKCLINRLLKKEPYQRLRNSSKLKEAIDEILVSLNKGE